MDPVYSLFGIGNTSGMQPVLFDEPTHTTRIPSFEELGFSVETKNKISRITKQRLANIFLIKNTHSFTIAYEPNLEERGYWLCRKCQAITPISDNAIIHDHSQCSEIRTDRPHANTIYVFGKTTQKTTLLQQTILCQQLRTSYNKNPDQYRPLSHVISTKT